MPIRFGRMAVSPFTFLRGSAAVMTADLAAVPTTGLQVQACGDCHLMNFGLFATPERNVVFGLNDFDETMPGPWEWDLKRLVASFVVAARDVRLDDEQASRGCGHRGPDLSGADVGVHRDEPARDLVRPDRPGQGDRGRARQGCPQASRATPGAGPQASRREPVPQAGHHRRWADADRGPATVDLPPARAHDRSSRSSSSTPTATSLADDRRVLFDRYRFEDAAIKIVGVGSVGTRCFVVLFTSEDGHPLLLQVKEANASVMAPYLGAQPQEGPQRQAGRRRPAPHAAGQRHLPRLGNRPERSRLLRPPAPRHEGVDHARGRSSSSS